jgi:hypothetical protein
MMRTKLCSRPVSRTFILLGLPMSMLLTVSFAKTPNEVRTGKELGQSGQVFWIEGTQPEQQSIEYIFVFDPVMGLFDVDDHKITEEGWANLRSPSPETTAMLLVPPQATLQALNGAIDIVASKGAFKKIQIYMRPL